MSGWMKLVITYDWVDEGGITNVVQMDEAGVTNEWVDGKYRQEEEH